MRSKKINISPLFLALFFSIFSVSNTFATNEEISKARQSSIIEHCGSIKESLKATQRSDSHARTYLGTIYETVLNQFVTPLNVRLIKNNQTDPELTKIQTDLVNTRTEFNSSFITYSKSLEELIAIDCTNFPTDFYQKLRIVRKERIVVDDYTKKMNQLISTHKQKVSEMEKKL